VDLQSPAGGPGQRTLQPLQPAFQLAAVSRGDESAHAMPADDRPLLFKIKQRFAQRGPGNAQLRGQVNLRGELLAWLVGPILDEAEQIPLHLPVERRFIGLERLHHIASRLMSYVLPLVYTTIVFLSRDWAAVLPELTTRQAQLSSHGLKLTIDRCGVT
jgi:hypothetical protein